MRSIIKYIWKGKIEMMTILFLSLAVIIAIVVILVSAKHIKKGFEARGEVKEQQRNENVSQEDEEILDKLKDKNLSPEDLKKIYEDLQKKK